MKIKYIVLLAVLLLFIAPVMAEDNNDTSYFDDAEVIGPDTSDDFVNYKFSLKKENTFYVNSSYNASQGSGSVDKPFRDVNTAFSEIALNRNIVNIYIAKGNYTLGKTISITKNLNIIGEDASKTIIKSDGEIFNINKNNLFVNIFNLTLSGGTSYYGGAIYNNRTTLNLVGDIFDSNTAKEYTSLLNNYSAAGGAIYNEAGYVKIYNSTFINNKAFSGLNAFGGVIYNDMGKVKVLNSHFANNSIYNATYGAGGVIYTFNGFLTVSNSTFINNSIDSAYSIGAVIYNYEAHNTFIINSTISNNYINGNYTFGIITNKGVLLEIINSTINNNKINGIAPLNSSVYNINGIYNSINTNFSNNTCKNITQLLLTLEDQMIISSAFDINTTLPSKYDLRSLDLVTSVKNQGNSGACWAFTTLAALESYLLKYENITYDFSENNMKNFMGSYGDNGSDWGEGGNYQMAIAYLLRWDGPVNESDDPFSAYSIISNYDVTKIKHVQDVVFVPLRMGYLDNDQIKYAIMKYGAVYTSIYGTSMGRIVYTPTIEIPNHAVAIVGWDDNYPANRFVGGAKPPANGAWIVKNSWGVSYGDKGYGYVSYYDNTFAGFSFDSLSVMAFTNVENTTNYKDIYQHDYLGNTYEALGYYNSTSYFANQFTSISDNPLKAFGFYTFGGSDFEVSIYVNDDLKHTQTGNVSWAGYHTVKLNKLVNLTKGDVFKISMKLTTPDSLFPIAIETARNGYSSKATASLNQSFVSPDGINWYDIAQDTELVKISDCMYNKTLKMTNVCLKAYTANVANLTLTITANTSYFKKNDSINLTVNLTNTGDYISDINISAIFDEIIKANTSEYFVNHLNNGESRIFNVLINIIDNKDVCESIFNIKTSDYSFNQSFKLYYSGFTKIIVENITIFSNTDYNLTILLVDMLDNPLVNKSIEINSANLTTDFKGKAYINLNLNCGSYNYTALFKGDSNFRAVNATFNVNVVKKDLTLSIDLLKIVKNSVLTYKITLKDMANTPLEITFKNKVYNKITDANGDVIVSFKITKTGKYQCMVNFIGDDNYYASNTTSIISINKQKSILKFSNLKFKAKSKKKILKAILKTSNGELLKSKKVTFKINNKKYSSKTNSKGVVSVKIKLSKKGNFKVNVNFAGDKLFLKSGKNGKVNIH